MSGACEAAVEDPPRIVRGAHAPLSVASGFAWVLAGYVGYMACQWGMIVALARWGSAEQVGQFHLALATTAPIIMFTNLGLRRVYATDARGQFRFQDYFGLRASMCAIALAVIAAVAWASGRTGFMIGVIAAMGIAKAIEAVSDILHGYFQHRRRIDIGAKSTLWRGPVSLAALIAAFLLTKSVLWAVAAMAAGWLAVVALYDLPQAARLRRTESPRPAERGAWASLARLSFPLGVVSLIPSLRASIPVFVIAAALGERWLGLFGAMVYFHAASNRVVSALGEAGTTPLATYFAAGDRASFLRLLGRMTAVTLGISLAGVIAALVAGRLILHAFYGADFASQSGVLLVIMASAVAANVQTMLDYAMTAARRLKIQPFLYGGGALLLLALCLALVPARGIEGAALALGLASLAETVVSGIIVYRAWMETGNRGPVPAGAAS